MWKYVGQRLLEVVPTTFGILLLTFLLFNVVGGSPAETILGKNATAESIAAFNHRYGYDKPLVVGAPGHVFDSQFFNFVKGVAKGDLGYSTELNVQARDPPGARQIRQQRARLHLPARVEVGGRAVGLPCRRHLRPQPRLRHARHALTPTI